MSQYAEQVKVALKIRITNSLEENLYFKEGGDYNLMTCVAKVHLKHGTLFREMCDFM